RHRVPDAPALLLRQVRWGPMPTLFEALREETLPRLAPVRAALERARSTGAAEHLVPVRELMHKLVGTAGGVGLPGLSQLWLLEEAAFSVRRASLTDAADRLPDCEVVLIDVPAADRGLERAAKALDNAQKLRVPALLTARADTAAGLQQLAARAAGLLTKPVR